MWTRDGFTVALRLLQLQRETSGKTKPWFHQFHRAVPTTSTYGRPMMPNARSLISLLNITSVCHFARRSCCRAFREEREAVVDSLYTAALPLSFVFLSFAPPAESRISVPSYRNWQEGSFHDLFIVDLFGFKLSRRTLSLFFSLGSTKPFANVLDFGMVYFSKGWTFSCLD